MPALWSLTTFFQFVDVAQRKAVIKHIYESLPQGGAFIISEKIESKNQFFRDFHHDFKKRKGYSETEISQKREALEQSLVPLSLEKNIEMLECSGFQNVMVFFRWYNFSSLIGQKL